MKNNRKIIRDICVKNNWFTDGSNDSLNYEKVLAMADAGDDPAMLARMICFWTCSDAKYEEIFSAITVSDYNKPDAVTPTKGKVKRDTNEDLMRAVHDAVVKSGNYARAERIIDYFLPDTYTLKDLTNYGFNFIAEVQFGGNEGIYIDCSLHGSFTEETQKANFSMFDKAQYIHCGTYKTLDDSLEAMKIMGELAGTLTYFANQYVNSNLDRYTPQKELDQEQERRKGHRCTEKGGNIT